MFELKKRIFDVIKSASKCGEDRTRWLGPEIAELGITHNGLDDVPLDSILVLAVLFSNGSLDDHEIVEITEIGISKLNDYIVILSEYSLVTDCPTSGKYQLTEKGKSACHDIFNNVVVRRRYELKRALENIERMYSKLSDIQLFKNTLDSA